MMSLIVIISKLGCVFISNRPHLFTLLLFYKASFLLKALVVLSWGPPLPLVKLTEKSGAVQRTRGSKADRGVPRLVRPSWCPMSPSSGPAALLFLRAGQPSVQATKPSLVIFADRKE